MTAVAVFHVLSGDTLRELLRRAHEGEDPDLLYLEFYANAELRYDYEEDDGT